MPPSHLATIRRHCSPLDPVPTDTEPVLVTLRGIRAALFDIYGTLFVSASGDVGTAMANQRTTAFHDALRAMGMELHGFDYSVDQSGEQSGEQTRPDAAANHLLDAIHDAHRHARDGGIEYPEVDIVSIWGDTLQRLQNAGLLDEIPPEIDLPRLAVEYEVRTNPTWPMPGALVCLEELRARGLRLGIVSNAQFFTRELFSALLDQTPEALGFEPGLQFYSYQFGWAKPGDFLYERAVEALADSGVPAHNVLYIGNDLLNDVAAAQHVGFRTALFAGDARSLRLRGGDPRVAGVAPDLIVTRLTQLIDCIE